MALINLNYIGTNNAICELTLNRPEVLNALNTELLDALTSPLTHLRQGYGGQAKVLIMRGAGQKAFSAGADLKERALMSLDDTRAFLRKINQVFDAIEALEIPTIAFLNGVAFGGGLELALACDIRIAVSHAELGLTECSWGIIPGAGGSIRLPKLVGYAKAAELIFSASKIKAEEALRIGLVNQVASSPMELANQIASCSGTSVQLAKRALKTGQEQAQYDQVLASPDRLEGLKAFTEKRKPHYI